MALAPRRRPRPAAAVEYAKAFAADMKSSGFAQKAIERMGKNADGVVVAQ